MVSYFVKTPNHFHLPKRIEKLGELAYNLWWRLEP